MTITGIMGCDPAPRPEGPAADRAGAHAAAAASDPAQVARDVRATLQVLDERGTRTFNLADVLSRAQPRLVVTKDPYYSQQKKFFAVPLSRVLLEWWPDLGAPSAAAMQSPSEIEFSASDGYKVRLSTTLALEAGAFLAFYDPEAPPFAKIGERQADPAPLYVIWEGNELTNLETHPRPWGIASIRRVAAGDGLEHTVPRGGFGADHCSKAGYELFSQRCLRCHSINQQGGRLGPDLNVPRNVLEYRSENDVRAYIVDPSSFRYGNMPAHLDLTEADLDQIICYLSRMGHNKFDPKRPAARPEEER